MVIALIPCSNSKLPGGVPDYAPSASLRASLGVDGIQRLMSCRRELAELLDEPPGPDLSFAVQSAELRYLPAFKRYAGNLYRAANLDSFNPSEVPMRVVIISALYGILEADELIRNYNHRMDESFTMAGQRVRLYTWWKRRGLGALVAHYCASHKPTAVYELLSVPYHRALAPWPPQALAGVVRPDSFAAMRTGAPHHRGLALARLIRAAPRNASADDRTDWVSS